VADHQGMWHTRFEEGRVEEGRLAIDKSAEREMGVGAAGLTRLVCAVLGAAQCGMVAAEAIYH